MSVKKWILIGAPFAILFSAAFLFIKPPQPPVVQLPNPNGYNDLVKAGQMIVGDLPECYSSSPLDEECLGKVRTFLQTNHEALKLARLGLSRESRVPFEFNRPYINKHFPELALLKRLALTLGAEGKVAEAENRMDDAIQSYLDAARLSQKMRGGVMIDAIVAGAVEAIGVKSLQKLSDAMTQEQRHRVIKNLSKIYAERDSAEEIMANEKAFAGVTTLKEKFAALAMFRSTRQVNKKFELKHKFWRTRLGLFLTDLAVKNFESDKGRLPGALQDLVPEYFSVLPKDDFSGNDFIYRPLTNGYQLYGVGFDQKDDGGKPLSDLTTEAKGDVLATFPSVTTSPF